MTEVPAGGASGPGRWPVLLLVTLVVVSPWPFGGAHLRSMQVIAGLASLGALLASLRAPGSPRPWGRDGYGSRIALLALWVVGLLQVVPLPAPLHAFLAPGSAAVWHPATTAVASALGAGPHPVSVDPEATWRWLALAPAVVGLGLVASAGLRTRRALLLASVAVVAGALLVAGYGIAARLLFGDKLYGVLAVPTIAPFGPFVSKNHFAGYVELAACLALGLAVGLADEARRGHDWLSWLESRRAAWVVATWGAAAVLFIAVPVSLSRGGVVSLAAGFAAFVAIRLSTQPERRRSARGLLLAACGLVIPLVVLASVLPDEVRARVRTLGDVDPAGAYRLDVWRDATRLFASSPVVGSGLGAFADALPRFKTGAGSVRVEHAENDFVEVLCEGGLVGLGLALAAAGSLLWTGWRSTREEPHRLARGVRAGALAGLVALVVHSVFDFNLRIPSNALLAAFLMACVLAPTAIPAALDPAVTSSSAADDGRRRAVYGAARLVPVIVALILALAGRWTPRELDLGAAQRAAAEAGPGLRRAVLERDVIAQLEHRPADASAWAMLAWLRLPRAPQQADALAAWAQQLDPQHTALRLAAQRVRDAAARALDARKDGPAQSQPRSP